MKNTDLRVSFLSLDYFVVYNRSYMTDSSGGNMTCDPELLLCSIVPIFDINYDTAYLMV